MVSVALLEPSISGNIGGVARVMANFECSELILINPQTDHLAPDARNRAKHAQSILKNVKFLKNLEALRTEFDLIVGTTSKLGSDYNVSRSPLSPKQLAPLLTKKKICVLFGREDRGLLNKEVALCDLLVTIPSSKKYPALNIVNAVTILLYELFESSKKEHVASHIRFASRKEREVLLKLIDQTLDGLDFSMESKKETQRTVWQRLLTKSFLTKREVFALCGFFKKVKKEQEESD